jgi:hypothetical protein
MKIMMTRNKRFGKTTANPFETVVMGLSVA